MTVFFLAKFFKNERHAEQLIRGRLYANKLSYFRAIEGDAARNDTYEGVTLWRGGELKIWPSTDDDRGEHQGITITDRDLVSPLEVQPDWTDHVNLFCMYAGHSGDYKTIPADHVNQFKKERLEIPDECLAFGEHAVIVDAQQFVERIKGAVRKIKNCRFARGLVRYDGKPPFDITRANILFYKRDEYKQQREFRFAFFPGEDIRGPLTLELGDLSDIAIRCNSSEINRNMQLSIRDTGSSV